MVKVSKLNGESVYVNPDLLRSIEVSPDTVLTFTDGYKLVVKESPQEVRASITEFKIKIENSKRDMQQG